MSEELCGFNIPDDSERDYGAELEASTKKLDAFFNQFPSKAAFLKWMESPEGKEYFNPGLISREVLRDGKIVRETFKNGEVIHSEVSKSKGASCKLTPDVVNIICATVAAGCTYKAAAARAGIDPATLHRWRANGEKLKSGKYHDFCEQLQGAVAIAQRKLEATVQASAVGGQVVTEKRTTIRAGKIVEEVVIEKTALPDGRLALMLLERRDPESWGKRAKLDITSNDEPLTVTLFGSLDLGSDGFVE